MIQIDKEFELLDKKFKYDARYQDFILDALDDIQSRFKNEECKNKIINLFLKYNHL